METYDEILTRMKQAFAQQAGYEVEKTSDLEVRLQVLAGEIYSALTHAKWLKEQAFPQTATGNYLTMHGTQRGLERKGAQAAVGALTFAVTNAMPYDLPIPLGTVCAVDKESTVRYITTQEATLKANTVSIVVKAAAKDGGRDGNTAANTVQIMITNPPGIKTVTNAEPFVGGVDAEDDRGFRSRLFKSYENISNGTNGAFYREFAMQHPAVASVGVASKESGVGTVAVYVATRGSLPADEVIAQLQEQFNQAREINVSVTVKPAVKVSVSITMQMKPAPNYTFEQAKDICTTVVDKYLEHLNVGGTIRISEMCKLMLETGAILNYKMATGADRKLTQGQAAQSGLIRILEGNLN